MRRLLRAHQVILPQILEVVAVVSFLELFVLVATEPTTSDMVHSFLIESWIRFKLFIQNFQLLSGLLESLHQIILRDIFDILNFIIRVVNFDLV